MCDYNSVLRDQIHVWAGSSLPHNALMGLQYDFPWLNVRNG